MGKLLESLLGVQAVEKQLSQVRTRLRSRQNAVRVQQTRIDKLKEQWQALHDRAMDRRKLADDKELTLKTHEEQVAKLRTALNSAKTNKEYAAILTQINTSKADNAKIEEDVIRLMNEIEELQKQTGELQEKIDQETRRLEEVQAGNADEVARLNKMLEDLQAKRARAAEGLDAETLALFDRIADQYEGEAIAEIERHGRKPPYDYVCGGCYMALNAEHANALQSRDEIRQCDNCGRILTWKS